MLQTKDLERGMMLFKPHPYLYTNNVMDVFENAKPKQVSSLSNELRQHFLLIRTDQA